MSDPEARDDEVPRHRCTVVNPENAAEEILAFLGGLAEHGSRPWCEVFYPAPPRLTPEEKAKWEARQLDTFDAVELVDGQIVTLPPYDVLAGKRAPHAAPIEERA